jgi:acetyl esterase/lipase
MPSIRSRLFHRGIVAKSVKGSGIAALVFDYALAPERPYPAALNDAVACLRTVVSRGNPGRGGDMRLRP